MSEVKNLQENLSELPKRGRKKATEKIEIDSPVAEEAQIIGKWLPKGSDKECSICHAVMMGWASREKFNYCPMCGAKME